MCDEGKGTGTVTNAGSPNCHLAAKPASYRSRLATDRVHK